MKKIATILIVIAIILLIIGLSYSILFTKKTVINSNYDYIDKTISKKRCLDNNICVDGIDISYNDEIGNISFMLINFSSSIRTSSFFKIVLIDKNNEEVEYILHYEDMIPNSLQSVALETLSKEIRNIKDYKLEELSELELEEVEV